MPATMADGTWTAWLLDAGVTVLRVTVVLLAAMAAARGLRSRSASLRHLVWTAALGAALLVPALEAGVPDGLRIPAVRLPASWASAVVRGGGGDPGAATPSSAATAPRGDRAGRTAAGAPPEPGGQGVGSAGGGTGQALARLAALIWLAGAAFVLLRTAWGTLRLARVRRRADLLEDPAWWGRAREVSEALGGPPRPRIRVSPEISVPLTTGVLRPTLLLPQEAVDEWSRARTDAVLVHELGHLARRDAATHVLARLACAVYWFHPLAWKAAREAARERERACDDLVLRAGTKASAYARELLEIAREAAPGTLRSAASVSVARRSDLEGRVLSLLEDGTDRGPLSRRSAAAALLPALALAAGLALLSVEPGAAGEAPGSDGPGAGARPDAAGPGAAAEGSAPRPAGRRDGGPSPGDVGGDGQEAPGARDLALSLVDLLDDPDAAVRAAAAEAVGEMELGRAVPALTAALRDPSRRVRREAAKALGKIEDPGAADALGRALASEGDRKVRKAVAWALGETETPEAVAALEEALGEVEDRWVRKKIVAALGETRLSSAVPVLESLLDADDRELRGAALGALVENDTGRARAALTAALESDDAELRAMAARALGRD